MLERGNLSRRGFLARSIGALTASGLPLWHAQQLVAAEEEASAQNKKGSPNDQIVMGAIGIGSPSSRGLGIYRNAMRNKRVKYVAACDVDARHLKRAIDIMTKDNKTDIAGYEDFRELCARKDIDAVTIGTPEHWHTLTAIEAMKQGKDVYCEKPLTLTVEEALALIKAVKETGRVFQTGSQQRSEYRGKFRLACELVRNGRIGKISSIECRIGSNPTGGPFKVIQPPKELNWEFWQGPVERHDYAEKRCHYQFRWWYEYSGGKMTDWGAHHIDIAQWALGMDGSGPSAIEAKGTPPTDEPHSYNCHPDFEVTYTYPKQGVKVIAMSKGDNGVKFNGENGQWIFVSRGKLTASDEKLIAEPLPDNAERLEVSTDHMGNFFDCMASRKKPICNVEVGAGSVIVCHIGAIALRLGKPLEWNPDTYEFNDEQANAMRSRPYQGDWKLPV